MKRFPSHCFSGQKMHLQVTPAKSATLAAALLVATLSTPLAVKAGSANRFYCGKASGAASTLATTASGKTVAVIRWTSTTFNSAGWSREKRCQAVSDRFEQYRQQGRLSYLTTGRMNGQPVICTTKNDGGACDGLLYTLKPGQNPTKTLRDLLAVRSMAKGPLNETTGRLYIKMSDLLDAASEISKPAPLW
jgi:hypothetical protein